MTRDPYSIVKHPLITEQTVALMDQNNVLVFIVDRKASKKEIMKAVEELYEVELLSINTLILPDGRKKAYVKLREEYLADEVATKIGVF
ncbi:MAG: 50S ribosomal protein L23 [Theionarchaea archaeon]|nr:MAG: 50S ribosomal protein L23 [Theionarchaea archaeon DG-70-1]MBU7026849.1 50S ribosomal protein L23 [Theionarchaea archaeon]